MRNLLCAALLLSASQALAADPTQGTWVVESVTKSGQPDSGLTGATRVHSGDRYSVTPAAGSKVPAAEGTLTVDDSKSPVQIDMKPSSGRYKGQTLKGIAKLEGDTLTICFAEAGQERPTAFASAAGSGHVLAVHKKK